MNAGCASKTVRSLENACHTWAPQSEVRSRRGAIQIHVYLYLYHQISSSNFNFLISKIFRTCGTQISYWGREDVPHHSEPASPSRLRSSCVSRKRRRQTRRSICSTAINCLAHYGRPVAARHVSARRRANSICNLPTTVQRAQWDYLLISAGNQQRSACTPYAPDSTALQPVNANNSQKPRQIILTRLNDLS